MSKTRYSKDVDVLLVELSDAPIDHAEEAGQFIVHFSKAQLLTQPVQITPPIGRITFAPGASTRCSTTPVR